MVGGNKGNQTDERKEVTKFCSKITKRANKKLASWPGDTLGMSKVLYSYDDLSTSYNGTAVWMLEAS